MDAAFDRLQKELKGRVVFHRLDWGSRKARAAADEFMLSKPPCGVITDAGGRVVMKIEGPRPVEAMRALLTQLSNTEESKNL